MDLTGHLLIAMPGMEDFRFDRSVVLLCTHGPDGAMGLIVNKPARDVALKDVLAQLDIGSAGPLERMRVHFGGPVETARGFVLHSSEYRSRLQTLAVTDDLAMTATQDILEDIAAGDGPAQAQVMLGYAGWGPGQLEGEIAANGWLTAAAAPDLVFGADAPKWEAAIRSVGIDPRLLSGSAGRA
ncbi:MAG: YqgE/AlgH family protein [Pseudomonadota bacterium]